MSDLKRKLYSTNPNTLESPMHHTRPRLSEIGVSPGQLKKVLDFLADNSISVSNFLITLLSFTPESNAERHAHALQDLACHVEYILNLLLGHSLPSFSVTVLQWVQKISMTVYKREIRSLTENDVGWQFTANRAQAAQFSDFQTAAVISTAASRAPLLWKVLDELFCIDGPSPSDKSTREEFQFKRDVKKLSCISSMVHANNQRCNMLQIIIGIFLHTCNTPERVVDLFFHIGLSCAQQTILAALDSLSKESVEHIKRTGQTLLVGYAYDNFDMSDKSKTPTIEQSTDCLRHLTSGTLLPLQFTRLPDLKSAVQHWKVSRFNDMKTEVTPRHTIQDLYKLHPESPDSHGQGRQERFISWQFLQDLCSYGPAYFHRFSSKIQLPDFVEKVPLFKTHQIPARAMDLSNSKVDGNIATIESLMKQGGVFDIDQFAKQHPEIPDPEDHFILFHGDLGTGERIQTAQLRRSLEATPRLRLQNVIFVPGLFHIKMACADALWRIFLQPASARLDDTSFFAFLISLRPSETSKIANGTAGYQILNECITHVGRVDRLGWWEKIIREKVHGCKTLEDFALREPTLETIEELSIGLSEFVSYDHLQKCQSFPAGQRDKQYENTVRRSQYFLLYEETAHAIRSGDVGRVETCLREWIPIFKAVGKHKYAAMLLQFLTDVHFVYPELLRKTIRYNWFCNISGKEMKYQGNDWLVELNNMLTKIIYGGYGSNNTVDRVMKESVLIQLFRDIIVIVEKQFGINPKLTRHGEPDMTATYEEMRRQMREIDTFLFKKGRKTAHSIRDAFEDGMLKLSTESSGMIADILLNSNETEQGVTEDDIIMEGV